MELRELLNYYTSHPSVNGLCEKINEPGSGKVLLSGLTGSASSVVFAAAYDLNQFSAVVILNDREEASYFFILVPQASKKAFLKALEADADFDLQDYGEIIDSGFAEEAPPQVMDWIKNYYNIA